ncbi:hypothetical protein AZ046_001471, partial [Klebsiella pneumoniae]
FHRPPPSSFTDLVLLSNPNKLLFTSSTSTIGNSAEFFE